MDALPVNYDQEHSDTSKLVKSIIRYTHSNSNRYGYYTICLLRLNACILILEVEMSSNYDWQNFQTLERIDNRLREAETHRLTKSGVEKRTLSISFNWILGLLEKSKVNIVGCFGNGIKLLQKHDVKV